MTSPPDWHVDPVALQAYVNGQCDFGTAASVEAHLLSCSGCRASVAGAVPPLRLAAVRAEIEDRLDAADRPWLERWLVRLGVREVDARVLLAAPSMRRAWWLAVLLALAFALLAAVQEPDRADALLLLAPVLPVLATAASYASRLDPALGITAATPYPAIRLLLLRSGVVAGASTLLAVAASAALPTSVGVLVWLLPAAALTAAVLALSNWMDAGAAAGVCCTGWFVAVWVAHRSAAGPLAVYGESGQLVSAALLLAAAAVLFRYRHRLDPGSPA